MNCTCMHVYERVIQQPKCMTRLSYKYCIFISQNGKQMFYSMLVIRRLHNQTKRRLVAE